MAAISLASVLLLVSDDWRIEADRFAKQAEEQYALKIRGSSDGVGWDPDSCWDCPYMTDRQQIQHTLVLYSISMPAFPAASLGFFSDVVKRDSGIWSYRILLVLCTGLFWFAVGKTLDQRAEEPYLKRGPPLLRMYLVLLCWISPPIFLIFLTRLFRPYGLIPGLLLEVTVWSAIGTWSLFIHLKRRSAASRNDSIP